MVIKCSHVRNLLKILGIGLRSDHFKDLFVYEVPKKSLLGLIKDIEEEDQAYEADLFVGPFLLTRRDPSEF